MHIRYGRSQDLPAIKQMWAAAFGSDEPYFSWYFNEVYRPERTLLLLEDQLPVSSLQFAPYLMMLHGEIIPVSYLVGVTTLAEYRQRGYGKLLLQQVISDLGNTQNQLLLLHTDIPAYYQQVGFVNSHFLRRLQFSAQACQHAESWRELAVGHVTEQFCDQIYRQMCSTRNGYILRTKQNWQQFIADHLTEATAHLYGSEQAYVLVWQENNQLQVREFGYIDEASLQDGLRFLRSHAAKLGLEAVVWDAPETLPLPQQLREQTVPHAMAYYLGETGSPQTMAERTLEYLHAPDPALWISEIT